MSDLGKATLTELTIEMENGNVLPVAQAIEKGSRGRDVAETLSNEKANLHMMEEINKERLRKGLTSHTLEIDPSSHRDGDGKIHTGELDLIRDRDKSLGDWSTFNDRADFTFGLKGYNGRLYVRPDDNGEMSCDLTRTNLGKSIQQ